MELASELAPRPWALERIYKWLATPDAPPVMLLKGMPGTGKSSVLVQAVTGLTDLRMDGGRDAVLVASVFRHPKLRDAFDANQLLTNVSTGLAIFPEVGERDRVPVTTKGHSVHMGGEQVGEMTGIKIFATGLSSLSELPALAVDRIQATSSRHRALVVVDALDQAEDEGATHFLQTLTTLAHAARGTGVRLLLCSRRPTSVGLSPDSFIAVDLVKDSPDPAEEIRSYLDRRFHGLDPSDRTRVVAALVAGAQGNWLWAMTNASAVEEEIAATGAVPQHVRFTSGLDGLYEDGVHRIRQRVGTDAWEKRARPLLGALACSFIGDMKPGEVRWVTGLEAAEISDLLEHCQPFIEHDNDGTLRLFHPDFSRWLLGGNVPGLTEETQHLKLAEGLTKMGRSTRWAPMTADYAAPWVLGHWITHFILDPFHPEVDRHEQEIANIIADARWIIQAGVTVESLEQAGQVAPRLKVPGHEIPLSSGVRALTASGVVGSYVRAFVIARLPSADLEQLRAAVTDDDASVATWMEQRSDIRALDAQALWRGVLDGHVSMRAEGPGIQITLSHKVIIDFLHTCSDRTSPAFLPAASVLTSSLADDEIPALISALHRLLDEEPVAISRPFVYSCLADAHQERADRRPDDAGPAADLEAALAAHMEAWSGVPPEHDYRVWFVIDVANALWKLPERSLDQLGILIEAQREIRAKRRAADDPGWVVSAGLLGDAHLERAERHTEEADRVADLNAALDVYVEAWQAAPPDHEHRSELVADVARTLEALPERSMEQVDQLIAARVEARDAFRARNNLVWVLDASLLGDAYMERAGRRTEEADRVADLDVALDVYVEAWQAAPPDREDRKLLAVDVADALMALPERSVDQVERLMVALREIRDSQRQAGGQEWVVQAGLLGHVYVERAELRAEEADRVADLNAALDVLVEAWLAVPADHEERTELAVAVTTTCWRLPERSVEQLDLLVQAHGEICHQRRHGEDEAPGWVMSASMLGDAYVERAERRTDEAERVADLNAALDAYVEVWRAVPADDEHRMEYAEDLADTLMALPARSKEQLDLLVEVQGEICDHRRDADDPDWLMALSVLGDSYRERADGHADDDADSAAARLADLNAALDAYLEVWRSAPTDHESRLAFIVDVANTLMVLPQRSVEQLDQLVEAQAEIRDAARASGSAAWAYPANLLGDAYRERADRRTDDAGRLADLQAALEAYTEAWQSVAVDDEHRIAFAIDVANTIMTLPERSMEQIDQLITAGREVVTERWRAGHANLAVSANVLGDAFVERADRRTTEAERLADLQAALEAYTEAWQSVAVDDEHRIDYAADVADTLMVLPERSMEQLEQLVTAGTEIRDAYRGRRPDGLTDVAGVLGDAYVQRADRRTTEAERLADLKAALEAYTEAWQSVAVDDEHRIDCAADVANTLRILPHRSTEELEQLIAVQSEIREQRRAAGDPRWPMSANLLGDAYRERAERRTDQHARVADYEAALNAYDEAWQAAAIDDEDRLTFAIDLANTRVVHAVIAGLEAKALLEESLSMVSSVVAGHPDDFNELHRLLPALFARLRRQQWWSRLD